LGADRIGCVRFIRAIFHDGDTISTMNQAFAIETENVCFAYPNGFEALHDVVFRARRGEFVAMLASNGSGKTTLIKVLVRLLQPTSGVVRIDGRDVRDYPQADLYKRLGLVFQNPNDQLFGATVSEDVACGPRNLDLSEEEVQQRVGEALESVGATELRERAIHHLSFGEQKRVAIAGVLAMRPSILVLDEPTAGLDPAGEHNMLRLLSTLNREQGITIIMATHSVDTLPLFADRIYLLNRGRVLKEGPSEEVFRDQDLLHGASLRLPYVSRLLDELKRLDGVPINTLPLTLREARSQLLELIPDELILPVLDERVS
jgi:cobalt/nickel transport system ATP-binding protein